jgi:indole-3-glycerol phosphate synthase
VVLTVVLQSLLQAEIEAYAARRHELAEKFAACARDRTEVIAKAKQYSPDKCALRSDVLFTVHWSQNSVDCGTA